MIVMDFRNGFLEGDMRILLFFVYSIQQELTIIIILSLPLSVKEEEEYL